MIEEYRRIFPIPFRTKDEAYDHLKSVFCEVLALHGFKNAKVVVSREPWEDGYIVKFKWEIQTNADRIRSMTDEELAVFLSQTEEHLFTGNLWSIKTWNEWLKKEVEE